MKPLLSSAIVLLGLLSGCARFGFEAPRTDGGPFDGAIDGAGDGTVDSSADASTDLVLHTARALGTGAEPLQVTSLAYLPGDGLLVGGRYFSSPNFFDTTLPDVPGSTAFLARVSPQGQVVWITRCDSEAETWRFNDITILGDSIFTAVNLGGNPACEGGIPPYNPTGIAGGVVRFNAADGSATHLLAVDSSSSTVARVAAASDDAVYFAGGVSAPAMIGNEMLTPQASSNLLYLGNFSPMTGAGWVRRFDSGTPKQIRDLAAIAGSVAVAFSFETSVFVENAENSETLIGASGVGDVDGLLVDYDENGVSDRQLHLAGTGRSVIRGVSLSPTSVAICGQVSGDYTLPGKSSTATEPSPFGAIYDREQLTLNSFRIIPTDDEASCARVVRLAEDDYVLVGTFRGVLDAAEPLVSNGDFDVWLAHWKSGTLETFGAGGPFEDTLLAFDARPGQVVVSGSFQQEFSVGDVTVMGPASPIESTYLWRVFF